MQKVVTALQTDLRKHEVETLGSELGVVLSHLRYVKRHLRRWMEPRKLSTPLAMTGTSSYVRYEPKGVALIISPWNYPFNLAMIPLFYAIAAGCPVTLKPSELSPATTAVIATMLGELFPPEEVTVVTGGAQTAATLTSLDYDHIFFTGSPAVGKLVMAAAAQNLTSVTLELGGKSPAVVDRDVNLKKSAANTAWGKFFNAGQTCIAPDYLLVHESIADAYVEELQAAITTFYGEDPRTSDSLARIISERHLNRLEAICQDAVAKGATLVRGGQFNAAERYAAPTILRDVTEEMDVMKEEIFGPLLPVLTYRTLDEAIEIINRRPNALSFYIQSNNRKTIRTLLDRTNSGGALVNEYLLGGGAAHLPFGGAGHSGIGKSFGHHGFVEFSNERAVLERKFLDLSFVYPPYTEGVTGLMRRVFRWL